MKKFIYLTCLLFLVQIIPASAQVCQGDVVLTSQDEVNAFNCETVLGTLLITGPDITSLEPLRGLKKVDEHFILQGLSSLTSLNGLQDLMEVTCSFEIKDSDALTDLSGLDLLTSVGRNFTVIQSENIKSLDGLYSLEYAQTLQLWENPMLAECCSVAPLLDIVGENFHIYDNAAGCDLPALENCDEELVCGGDIVLLTQEDFDNFNCTKIEGDLIIGVYRQESTDFSTSNLQKLKEVTGNILINPSAPEQLDFSNLEKIGGGLNIESHSLRLGSFSSLNLVSEINLTGVEITGSFSQINNPVETIFLRGVTADGTFLGTIPSIGSLWAEGLDITGDYCDMYPTIPNAVQNNQITWYFNSVELTDILACSDEEINCEGDVMISTTEELLAFNCETVNGNLIIDLPRLNEFIATDLGTLRSLKEVKGDLIIRNLTFLLISVSDLQSLETVGGSVIIENNDNLRSIQGLSQLTTIGGDLIVRNNTQMTDLGVFGLQHVSNVEITNNPQLNYCCEVDYMDRENIIEGNLVLSGNGSGCSPEALSDCSSAPTVCEGNVYLTNQYDVDKTDCEIIEGTLFIYGGGTKKLESLTKLREIKGDFEIYQHDLSFIGLENLERVGGIIDFSDFNIPTIGQANFDLDPLVSLRSIGGFYIVIDHLFGSLNLTEPIGNIYWGYTSVIDDISWIENVPAIDTFRIEAPGNDYFGTIADRVAEGGYMDIGRVSVTDSVWNKKSYINFLNMTVETESLDFMATLERINDLSLRGRVTTQDICGAYNFLKNGEIGELSWGIQWIPPDGDTYELLTVEYILNNCAPEEVAAVSIYPNPSGQEIVTLAWEEKTTGDTQIQVLDNNGREVMRQQLPANGGARQAQLNTSALDPGFYLIRITNNGETQLRRFVKN